MVSDRESRLQRELNQIKCQRDNVENALQTAHKDAATSKEAYSTLVKKARNMQEQILDMETREARNSKVNPEDSRDFAARQELVQKSEQCEAVGGQLAALRSGQAAMESAARKAANDLAAKSDALCGLHSSAQELNRLYQKACDELAAMTEDAATARAAAAEAKHGLAASQAAVAAAREDNRSLLAAAVIAHNEVEKEATRACAAAAEAVHLRAGVAELQDSLNMAKSLSCRAAEADDLQEKLKAERGINGVHTEHLAHVVGNLAAARAATAERDATITAMGAALDERAERIDALAAAKSAAEKRAAQMEQALAVHPKGQPQRPDMTAAMDAMRVTLVESKEKVSLLEASTSSQDQRLHIAVAAAEATRKELRTANGSLAASRDEATGMSAHIQDKERALASLQRSMETQKGATMQACAALDAAKVKGVQEQDALATQVEDLQARLGAAVQHRDEALAAAACATQTAAAGKGLVASLNARVDASQAQIAPLRAKLDELADVLDVKDMHMKELAASRAAMEAQRDAAVDLVEGRGGDAAQVAALQKARAQLAAAVSEISALKEELGDTSEAKESACAEAQALQRRLEDVEEGAAEKLRSQQRHAAEQKSSAERGIAAAKADCATAVGSAVALEHKLSEARQEAETERRLTLQLREDIAAAEDETYRAGQEVLSLKVQLEEAAQEAVVPGTGSFQRTRRQLEAMYADKIAVLEDSLANSKQALDSEASATHAACEEVERPTAQLASPNASLATALSLEKVALELEAPQSPPKQPEERYSLRSGAQKGPPVPHMDEHRSPGHKVQMATDSPNSSPSKSFVMSVDART